MENEIKNLPKTPHEEIMFCIESTNDIVSKILDILTKCYSEATEGLIMKCKHQAYCRFFRPSKFDASICTREQCKYEAEGGLIMNSSSSLLQALNLKTWREFMATLQRLPIEVTEIIVRRKNRPPLSLEVEIHYRLKEKKK